MKTIFSNQRKRGAFTLVELLVVIVIMGFLASLVAPKLAGFAEEASCGSCQTNQERLQKYVMMHVYQNNELPSGLTNMVISNNPGDVAIRVRPEDGNKRNGAEEVSKEFYKRFKPILHYINATEADELEDLGIAEVYDLAKTSDGSGEKPDAENNIVERNVRRDVADKLGMLMIGLGCSTVDSNETNYSSGEQYKFTASTSSLELEAPSVALNATDGTTTESNSDKWMRMEEGKFIGRLVLGVGDATFELVKSEMLDSAGTCPDQILSRNQYSWGNYLLIVPRLEETIKRVSAAVDTPAKLHYFGVNVNDDKTIGKHPIILKTEGTKGDFSAQKESDFEIACPNGHVWGDIADSYLVSIEGERS